VILHAEVVTPYGLTAGTGVIVALFGRDYTAIALGKFLEARKAVALVIALAGDAIAVDAENAAGAAQSQRTATGIRQIQLTVTDGQ
jgi:hypothetical protein